MDHFKTAESQLDGSLFSPFEESLLEIDEEEDTTDFGDTFLVPPSLSRITGTVDLAKLSSNVKLNQSQWTHSLQERMVRHNKDLRIICQDGSLQIDPSVLMSFMRDRTSFLRLVMDRIHRFQGILRLALLSQQQQLHECVQTIILPNIFIQDLRLLMALLHQREIQTCERRKIAIIEIITLLGLSLDNLIIEPLPIKFLLAEKWGFRSSDFVQPVVPKTKLPASVVAASPRPTILKEDQLLLSLTAPLAKDDLMPANTIKRPEGQISIFSVQPEVRSSWECMIKEENNPLDIQDFFLTPVSSVNCDGNKKAKSSHGSSEDIQSNSYFQTLECSSTTSLEENSATIQEINNETVYNCDLCGQKFGLVDFLKHQRSHVNDSPYKCSQHGCKRKFKTLSEFRAHRRVSHKPRNNKKTSHKTFASAPATTNNNNSKHHNYFCTQCKKCFKSVGSLKTHMISHMILPNLPAHLKKNSSCDIIKNKNNNNNEVPESIAKGVFTCRICSTAHITWFEFSRHFLKHHGVEPKILLQYKCVPCDLLFQTKEVYLEHINRKCPSDKNKAAQGLTCPKAAHGHNCPMPSLPKSHQQHQEILKLDTARGINSVGYTEKKHICTICLRAFKRSDNLKAHARTVHYGLKPNNCNSCGKGYRTKNELLKHLSKSCPFRTELSNNDNSYNGQISTECNQEEEEFQFESLLL